MTQCQVEIVTSRRDRLNDLEELMYSVDPERVNVPSKIEQLRFLTSKTRPSTVLESLVRNFSGRLEWVPPSAHTLTNVYPLWFSSLCTELENHHRAFTGTTLGWDDGPGHVCVCVWAWDATDTTTPSSSPCQATGALGHGHHSLPWTHTAGQWERSSRMEKHNLKPGPSCWMASPSTHHTVVSIYQFQGRGRWCRARGDGSVRIYVVGRNCFPGFSPHSVPSA